MSAEFLSINFYSKHTIFVIILCILILYLVVFGYFNFWKVLVFLGLFYDFVGVVVACLSIFFILFEFLVFLVILFLNFGSVYCFFCKLISRVVGLCTNSVVLVKLFFYFRFKLYYYSLTFFSLPGSRSFMCLLALISLTRLLGGRFFSDDTLFSIWFVCFIIIIVVCVRLVFILLIIWFVVIFVVSVFYVFFVMIFMYFFRKASKPFVATYISKKNNTFVVWQFREYLLLLCLRNVFVVRVINLSKYVKELYLTNNWLNFFFKNYIVIFIFFFINLALFLYLISFVFVVCNYSPEFDLYVHFLNAEFYHKVCGTIVVYGQDCYSVKFLLPRFWMLIYGVDFYIFLKHVVLLFFYTDYGIIL